MTRHGHGEQNAEVIDLHYEFAYAKATPADANTFVTFTRSATSIDSHLQKGEPISKKKSRDLHPPVRMNRS